MIKIIYCLPYKNLPVEHEYLQAKSALVGDNVFNYWVTKKQDDPNYELINSDIDSILNLISKNQQQNNADVLSQMAKTQVFNAQVMSDNAKQKLINAQLLGEIAKLKGSN